MVRGIESFREWFRGYEEQYAVIGGTACDLLMADEGLDFRATKDIDLVLIIEAVDAAFGRRFWEYILTAGYEHRNKSTGEPQFYRFTNPRSKAYPFMIEPFAGKPDVIALPNDAVLSPLLLEEDISSLSAILLDNDQKPLPGISETIRKDMKEFIEHMQSETVDLKQLGILNESKESILNGLSIIYG